MRRQVRAVASAVSAAESVSVLLASYDTEQALAIIGDKGGELPPSMRDAFMALPITVVSEWFRLDVESI
eukprot:gene46493-37028_t